MKCCGLPEKLSRRPAIVLFIHEMKKGFLSYLTLGVLSGLATLLTGCNSSETWGTDPQELSGTAVTAFSLKPDQTVLNNLDSVYFSIDLIDAQIFNANPLPYDTKIDNLAVSISSDQCSVAQLIIPATETEEETVVDYLAAPETKINFSNGPVVLHLVSADGNYQRDYRITVNVAAVEADSLYWDKVNAGNLYGIPSMNQAKAVKVGDKALMISRAADGKVGISSFIPSPKSGGGNWESSLIQPVFTANDVVVNPSALLDITSFTSTVNGDLYICDTDGNLYRSTDKGINFDAVDTGWESITAPYKDAVLGIRQDAGERIYAVYPPSAWGSAGKSVPATFPVSGVSQAAVFSTKWAVDPQIVIVGGKSANGQLSGAAWAFDGNKWAQVSNSLPVATGYAMSKYIIAETDTLNWKIKQREVLMAFGGNGNKEVTDVWISRDMGVNWQKGSESVQLPKYMPFTTGASLLVFDKMLDEYDILPLAVTPITTWECPYLYLFAGYDAQGNLNNQYWSGVVNHLRFKPLQ